MTEHDEGARTELGTRAHYEDAEYYDQAYRKRRDDVRFYAHMATKIGGPVLELGCGTGRVTQGIVERGIEVVGVDAVDTMLERGRARLSKPKRVAKLVEWVHADLRGIRLKRRFPLVISPFNVFNHLYSRQDLELALQTVREHLEEDGRFVFDVRMPFPSELARDPEKVYRIGTVRRPDTKRRYHYRERFEYDPITQVQQIDFAFVGVDDPSDFHMTPLTHRVFFPAELEALLHYNGFAIEHRYGDWSFEPLDAAAESQVFVCALR